VPATSLASESCFWLEAVDEELGVVTQSEPLIIPFSVAVMMSVGMWYRGGFWAAGGGGDEGIGFEGVGVEVKGRG
jgi:hypothetical protein